MDNLSPIQKTAVIIGGVAALLFLGLYIASSIFFDLVKLPDDALKPWSIIEYWIAFHNNPKILKNLIIASATPVGVSLLLLLLTLVGKKESLFGDARFATKLEVQNKGLINGSGIILGKIGGDFIIADGTEHVLVAAPTRSGKGVGIVIPNLLNWDGSCVVLDIKLENYAATSGFRKKHGHNIFLFAPGDKNGVTHRYNPLDIIEKDNKNLRINDIQKIAIFLCPTPLDGDPMWANEGRNLFIAIVLYLIDTQQELTLGNCNRFIKTYSNEELIELVEEKADSLDTICIANFNNFLSMGDKQASGVKSTLTSSLSLYDNPIVDAATSTTDFNFADLRKKKMTIYVGITPDKLKMLAPLLNIFFQQCCDVLISSLPDKKTEPHKVLMLLDEFTSLGRMDIIKDGIAFFAGYHLRLMPIIQGPSQLEDKYGVAGKDSMITNFMYQVVFAPNNNKDADEISASLGQKTVKAKSKSVETFSGRNGTTSTSETGRALMLPQEIRQMNRKASIILIEAMLPIKAKKVIYYADEHFKGRFYNVYDPSKNTGPLPTKIPQQTIEAKRFVKELVNSEHVQSEDDGEGNPVEIEISEVTQRADAVMAAMEWQPEKTLDESEMGDLLMDFWATGEVEEEEQEFSM